MLYRETTPNVFERWDGGPINGVLYPPEIEDLWSDEMLAAIGLERALPAGAIPPRHKLVDSEVRRMDGKLQVVYITEDLGVSGADINKERQRRIEQGCMAYTLEGAAVGLQGDAQSRENLNALAQVAAIRSANGDTTETTYRDAYNIDHTLTPAQVITVWMQGIAYVDAVYNASWALKAMDTIPDDYTADTHWPDHGLPADA